MFNAYRRLLTSTAPATDSAHKASAAPPSIRRRNHREMTYHSRSLLKRRIIKFCSASLGPQHCNGFRTLLLDTTRQE